MIGDLRQWIEADLDLTDWLGERVKFLEASEIELLQEMAANGLWDGAIPAKPEGHTGELEFGLGPYYLHHPPSFLGDFVNHIPGLKALWDWLLADWVPCHLTPAAYEALSYRAEHGGLVVDDGGIYAVHTYNKLDSGWIGAFLTDLHAQALGKVAAYPDPSAPVTAQPLAPRTSGADTVRLALLSDWGTGHYEDDPAGRIVDQALAQAPDYLLHLGDIYYAGTDAHFHPPHEATRNFLALWPGTDRLPAGRSLAVNGNHEMYAGGHGYFGVVLQDPRFALQNGVGYFALTYGGWTVLGLDTAYYSQSFLYLSGNLGPDDCGQMQWLHELAPDPQRTILLTHHNGLALDASAETPLWGEVRRALGGDPALWYWGHVHYGVAYASPTPGGRATRARCIGHGALPFARARLLAQAAQQSPSPIDYWVQSPYPHARERERMRNGFATLDLHADGSVTERFFELDRDAPQFTNRIAAPDSGKRRPN